MYFNAIASEATCNGKNAEIRITEDGKIAYVATRPIREGEELLTDYGPKYFKLT